MNDFDASMIIILVVIITLTATTTYFNNVQDTVHEKDISDMKKAMNDLVIEINDANLDQNNNIEKLCGAINGCEYGK